MLPFKVLKLLTNISCITSYLPLNLIQYKLLKTRNKEQLNIFRQPGIFFQVFKSKVFNLEL